MPATDRHDNAVYSAGQGQQAITGAEVKRYFERTNAWLLAYRRLAVRFDRQAASVLAFLHLACALICLRFLQQLGQD